MSGRARRQAKAPRKFGEDASDGKGAPGGRKYVMRLLEEADITRSLLKRELYLLWPDDGVWYPAKVRKVDVGKRRADVIYTTTDEEENINLAEVVGDKSIAFREARPASHQLGPNEVLDEEERPYAQSPPPDSDSEDGGAAGGAGGSGAASGDESEPPPDEAASEEEASEAEAPASEDASMSEGSDDEGVGVARRRARGGSGSDSEPEAGEQAPKKRRRVVKAGEAKTKTGRPRRQITLSSKAQELLSGERQAQLEAILQGRDVSAQARAEVMAALPPEERPGRDDFSSAEAYEKQLLAQLAGGGSGGGGGSSSRTPPARGGSLKKQQAAAGTSAAEVREKAVEAIAAALDKVAGETGAGDLPDAKGTAEGVEMALFSLYGEVGKDYKAKYRSLIFNLRDAANPDLRRRVLRGEIPPAKLVQLGPAELASKQLSAWREEKEKEAMKAAVLDTEAAAKFSTAAALASRRSERGDGAAVDWRDSTLATASPPRDQGTARRSREGSLEAHDGGGNGGELQPRPSGTSGELDGGPQAAGAAGEGAGGLGSGGEASGELRTTPSMDGRSTAIRAGGSGFNWSSVKASALQEWEAAPGSGDAAAAAAAEEGSEPEYVPGEDEEAEAPAQAGQQQPDGVGGAEADADAFAIAETTGSPHQVWHGVLGNACPVPLPVVIEYLAGNPALAAALPARQVDVKGRVQLDRAADFMRGLKASRSRTLSLGLIRLAPEAGEEEAGAMGELLRQYRGKERCGVLPLGDAEYYLLAAGGLASGLLCAAGGGVHALKDVPQLHLLVVAVHRKELRLLPRSQSREGRPPQQHQQQQQHGSATPGSEAGAPPTPIVSPPAAGPPQLTQASPGHGPSQPMHASPAPGPPPPPPPLAASRHGGAPGLDAAQAGRQGSGGPPQAQPLPQAQAQQQLPPQQQQLPPQQQPSIDFSSLGSLAAVLGVSQGLTLPGLQQQQQQPGSLPPHNQPFPLAGPAGRPYAGGPQQQPLPHSQAGYGAQPQGNFMQQQQQQQQQQRPQWAGQQHPQAMHGQGFPPPGLHQQQPGGFPHHMQQQQQPMHGQPGLHGMGGYGQQQQQPGYGGMVPQASGLLQRPMGMPQPGYRGQQQQQQPPGPSHGWHR